MNPFDFLSGASGIAGLLGSIFGGGGRPSLAQLQRIISPQAIGQTQNQFFQQLLGSQYGQFAQTNANLMGARLGQQLRTTAALAGGTTSSPFAALAGAAASTTQGVLKGQALSDLSSQAFNAAIQNRQSLLQAFLQSQGQPSGLQQGLGQLSSTFGQLSLLHGGQSGGGQGGSGFFFPNING
jgi:hypothetical protein